MADRLLHRLPEPDLELALRDLARTIEWPTAHGQPGEPDLAAAVRVRIEAGPRSVDARWPDVAARLPRWTWRPAQRALLLALVALLAVAALAAAVGLGLPGLRLILGEAPGSAPPTVEPRPATPGVPTLPGASMGLGEPLDPGDPTGLTARAGFPVGLPADPVIGPPTVAYLDESRGGQVTLLWPVDDELPATRQRGVGLLLSEFEGTVNEGFFTKVIGDGTILERVRVDGQPGYWISGEPHVLFWDGPSGSVDDSRRWVGDVLLWSDGTITYRLESALGRDAAIRIAETLP